MVKSVPLVVSIYKLDKKYHKRVMNENIIYRGKVT